MRIAAGREEDHVRRNLGCARQRVGASATDVPVLRLQKAFMGEGDLRSREVGGKMQSVEGVIPQAKAAHAELARDGVPGLKRDVHAVGADVQAFLRNSESQLSVYVSLR